jgi:hypothetical protein
MGEKQVGLSDLIKHKENQIVTWLRFEPRHPAPEYGPLLYPDECDKTDQIL